VLTCRAWRCSFVSSPRSSSNRTTLPMLLFGRSNCTNGAVAERASIRVVAFLAKVNAWPPVAAITISVTKRIEFFPRAGDRLIACSARDLRPSQARCGFRSRAQAGRLVGDPPSLLPRHRIVARSRCEVLRCAIEALAAAATLGRKGSGEDETGSMGPDRVHDGSSRHDIAAKRAVGLGERSLDHVDPPP
jgi:hypothetical protein